MYRTIKKELKIPQPMFNRFYLKAGEILARIGSTYKAKHPLVYHYTTGAGLEGIARSKKIWATHIGFLNDTEEFREAARLFAQHVRGRNQEQICSDRAKFVMRLLSEGINESISAEDYHPWFITSFTECRNDLAQWRSYSSGESKFALGFELNHIWQLTKHLGNPEDFRYAIQLAPVVYDSHVKDQIVNEAIDFIISQYPLDEAEAAPKDPSIFAKDWLTHFMSAANMVAPLLKHGSFEQEHEWRLIVTPNRFDDILYRNRGALLTPYIEIDLCAISIADAGKEWPHPFRECWVGPSQHKDANFFSSRNMLAKENLLGIQMHKSDIPFRDI